MSERITGRTTVREVVTRYPGAVAIFDKYGLTGCGGPDGPVEPVGFFAAVHHVDPEALIRELNEYATSIEQAQERDRATPASSSPQSDPYRVFLSTALVLTLGAGVTTGVTAAMTGGGWGGLGGDAWLALVQAHGHGQLFGFLGLFIMGMAYHIIPRFKALPPPDRRLVFASYAFMTLGVLLRLNAQPHPQGFLRALLAASGPLELAGAAIFAWLIAGTLLRARDRREPYDRYLIAASLWFVAVSAIDAWLVIDAARNGERVLDSAGDMALLTAGVYGFVMVFVLGVSFRVLPFFMALPPARGRLRDVAFVALAVAVPLRVAAVWAPALTDAGWAGPMNDATTFVIAAAVATAVLALRIFEPSPEGATAPPSPPGFGAAARVAYVWLLIGVALDVYWRLREMEGGFTPFYAAGAIRHATLLGFATLMIMAIGYRTVPVFSGRELRWPAAIVPSFVLAGAGVVLRVAPVAFTTAPTDLDFKLMIAGGFLLFAALAVFSAELASSMFAWPVRAASTAAAAPASAAAQPGSAPPAESAAEQAEPATGPIRGDMTVADAIAAHPVVLRTLISRGFAPLADPEMRARMAPTITLERAAAVINADPNELVESLNAAVLAASRAGAGAEGIEWQLIDTTVSKDLILTALKSCYDPEIPVNIVDLGLVYKVVVREAYIHVTMTLTAPGCPMADEVEAQVREALAAVPGVETVDVDVVQEPPWTPERMSAEARAALGWA
ncbi:MAG TPA: iron-sulfur cluster assembly protein [Dehalococcoidia bacterium]|nr:iron-sulfur cluster assembly protein [Dehalococcoidia bacterium]